MVAKKSKSKSKKASAKKSIKDKDLEKSVKGFEKSLTSETLAEKLRIDEAVISGWLMGPARSLDMRSILEGFGRLCIVRGLPFHRIGLFVVSIHPHLVGSRYAWSIKDPVATEISDRHEDYIIDGVEKIPEEYLLSPMYQLFSGLSGFIYRPLHQPDCSIDYPILHDLKGEGATDYLALRMQHSGSSSDKMVMTFASYKEGGFGDEYLLLLRRLMPLLSLVLELVSSRDFTKIILDTYVGKRSGQLVVDGRIHKGDGELIPAVIWFCDMREFTKLANRETPKQLVSSLNDFFGCMVDSVDDAGGEVLKFMGDAVMAIFPLPKGRRHFASAVCETALAAAEDAKDKLAKVNKQRVKEGRKVLEFGVSMHVGEVNYGNIGGGSRLDFTVLGSAVNLASRLQGLHSELGKVILVSDDFRDLSKREFEHMGDFALKGIRGKRGVYALKR